MGKCMGIFEMMEDWHFASGQLPVADLAQGTTIKADNCAAYRATDHKLVGSGLTQHGEITETFWRSGLPILVFFRIPSKNIYYMYTYLIICV